MSQVWKTETQSLKDPWKTWLTDTHLLGPSNGVAVLYIPVSMKDIAGSFEFSSTVFGLARSIHPGLQSLIISSDSIYELVVKGQVSLADVKVRSVD